MITKPFACLLSVGLLGVPLAQAQDTSTTTDMNTNQALAGTDSRNQGIEARRERLQMRGDAPIVSGTQFNPAISVILDGLYSNFSRDVEDPPGFDGGHGHGHGHGHGIEEGFQLRSAEVVLSGPVDPYFDMMVVMAVSPSDIELEEAFITTRALPAGLQVKAGKFLSDVGYLNRQHIHDWDFVDQPWVNEFIFGEEGLNEVGAQLSWLAPTRNYTRFGVEILQGETPGVASYVGEERKETVSVIDDGTGSPQRIRFRDSNGLKDKAGPRLFTAFANYAPDIGYDHAVQFGISGGYADTFQDEDFHSSARLETWEGDAWFAGVDAVYKYNGSGVMGHGDLTLQAEYFIREQDLTYREFVFSDRNTFSQTEEASIRPRQDGMYLQGVYGFAPRWNGGLRLDALGLTNKAFDAAGPDDASTSLRYTGQLSYAPSEFSRIRAQVAYNDLHEVQGHDHDDHGAWQFTLQYNISLGAHGAHSF